LDDIIKKKEVKVMEQQIIAELKKINGKLDGHSEILKSQSEMLKEHSQTLKEHSEILKEHSEILKGHSLILKEHSLMLGALKTGQELLKAELSELRIQNAKDFGEIRELIKGNEVDIELLKEDNWENKKDIRRVQQTLGMS
jgi:hypothetical protein